MKNNSIKTKVIATALSAITVFSAATFTTTTAFAAETRLSTGTTMTNEMKVSLESDLKYATNISSATILKVLDGTTKYGKYFAPALGGLLDAFIEKAEERRSQQTLIIHSEEKTLSRRTPITRCGGDFIDSFYQGSTAKLTR